VQAWYLGGAFFGFSSDEGPREGLKQLGSSKIMPTTPSEVASIETADLFGVHFFNIIFPYPSESDEP
jgi:hypothetical protein